MNGLSYKLYKQCERVVAILTNLLNKLWKAGYVPEEWCRANGVYIPKEEQSSTLGQFRPISLLNVEGKIYFGVLAKRLTRFLLDNGFIITSVHKAGVPGFPGCLYDLERDPGCKE